ncbi:hypothetical protein EDF77_1908 [Stenotrophomonas maltophilia]|uniref:hypothetical protein n=1 Tax=Stenotrophomonas chelatiphaga TaxID=517011 RepID=UPI000F4C3779|nr:hypothetical protein [Stenotrophomonas chelatiphaga]MCS4231380.1 hypothetical protein [Stenotrophomonas chelatiphaga]ROQ42434.1 hypothetical protein EDF77_1908 [Stenotrophomonas maltophilia]
MSRANWPIAGLGVLWWWMETSYFGGNIGPGSVAELYADGLALVFYAAAFAFPPRKPLAKNVGKSGVADG